MRIGVDLGGTKESSAASAGRARSCCAAVPHGRSITKASSAPVAGLVSDAEASLAAARWHGFRLPSPASGLVRGRNTRG
jgi:hypothetical protein